MNLDLTFDNRSVPPKRSRRQDDLSYRQRKAALGLRQLSVWVPGNCYDGLIVLLSDHAVLSKVIGFYYSIQPNPPIVKRNVRSSPNKDFIKTLGSKPPTKISRSINYEDLDRKLNLLTEQINSLSASVSSLVSKSENNLSLNDCNQNIGNNVQSVI